VAVAAIAVATVAPAAAVARAVMAVPAARVVAATPVAAADAITERAIFFGHSIVLSCRLFRTVAALRKRLTVRAAAVANDTGAIGKVARRRPIPAIIAAATTAAANAKNLAIKRALVSVQSLGLPGRRTTIPASAMAIATWDKSRKRLRRSKSQLSRF